MNERAMRINEEFSTKEADEKRKAEEDEAFNAEHLKRVGFFKQHSNQWLNELFLALKTACDKFNSDVVDKSKHLRVTKDGGGKIEIHFINPQYRTMIPPSSSIHLQNIPDFKLIVQYDNTLSKKCGMTSISLTPTETTIEVRAKDAVISTMELADQLLVRFLDANEL